MPDVQSITLSGEQVTDPEAADALQSFLDSCADSHYDEVRELSKELGVTESCARAISYLRMRSRWTEELEEELIALHRAGSPPNIFEFGN